MARLIKKDQLGGQDTKAKVHSRTRKGPERKVIEREVYQAQQEAAKILTEAELERQNILEHARHKAERAYAATEQMVEGEISRERQAQLFEHLHELRHYIERLSLDQDHLCQEIVSNILGKQVQKIKDAGLVSRVDLEAIGNLKRRVQLKILISPATFREICEREPEVKAALLEEVMLKLELNETLELGRWELVYSDVEIKGTTPEILPHLVRFLSIVPESTMVTSEWLKSDHEKQIIHNENLKENLRSALVNEDDNADSWGSDYDFEQLTD